MRAEESGALPAAAINVATLSATAMIAQQVAGKVTRDALFLSQFQATDLPRAMVAASVLSILASVVFSQLLARSTPVRLVPRLFALSAVLFVVEWVIAGQSPGVAAVLLYVHMAMFGLLVVSGFWSLVNERFDPHTAKRAVGRIGAGAAFGGVLGGILADRVAALADLRAMLLLLAGLHALCTIGVAQIGRLNRQAPVDDEPEPQLGLAVILQSPYLQQIAWLVALGALVAAPLDYALKAQAAERYESGEALVAFFALFYTTTGIAGFLVQRLLAFPALRRLGLGGTLAVLPSLIFVTSLGSALFTRLWTVVAARGSEALLANSLFRSGLELLYTPVSPAEKRPSKAIIDVAAQRAGDLAGAGLVLLVLLVAPGEASVRACVALAAAGSLISIFVVRLVHRGYVNQLASSLRRGVITLDAQEVLDATTARTLARTRASIDRSTLLTEVERYRERWVAEAGLPELRQSIAAAQRDGDSSAQHDDLHSALDALLAADPESAKGVLSGPRLDLRLVRCAIPWIGHPEVREAAISALSKMSPRIVGQLQDALLDASVPLVVRTRIPAILEVSGERRAVEALLLGLEDEDFAVRFWCAQSLARLTSSHPELKPPPERVLAIAQREAEVDGTLWEMRELTDFPSGSILLDSVQRRRVRRSVEHVFTLIAVVLDAETIRFCLFALASEDPHLRGTALEYLENVLPEGLRRALLDRVGAGGEAVRSARSAQELARELHRSISPLVGGRSRT